LDRRVFSIADQPKWGGLPAREWDTSVWCANIAKIKTELGWQPAFSFERGFYETVDWFRGYPNLGRDYPSAGA
jgi:nucleoside-diphosphate-sugar epimerase